MPPIRIPTALVWLIAALPASLSSQQAADVHASAPVVVATRVGEGAIRIDGLLSEDAWSGARPVTSFTQSDPDEGEPASQATDVRIAYDAAAIYVGATLSDTSPISSRLARRDRYLSDSDWFGISLDTHHDHRTAYSFSVNPAGVKIDAAATTSGGDPSWDPVWDVSTAVTPGGWVVEMRIPFSQLRFSEADVQRWGIQIQREIARQQETASFAFTPQRDSGGIPRYGHLIGVSGIERGHGLELMPYVASRAELVPLDAPSSGVIRDPYSSGRDVSAAAGLDLKLHLASNLTLDATINPDFGQVEVDPAVINLTQYETRFDEKRPFFIEGASIFEFGEGAELLYSRRIGESPEWDRPRGALYEDVPEAATILGAVKLTGRSAGGWSIGVLDAVTQAESARYIDAEGIERTLPAAARSNFGVLRVLRSFNDDRSSLGMLATTVNRGLGQNALREQLTSGAFGGGVDFRHRWANNAWLLNGHVAVSRVDGSSAAIGSLQRSSARYFHRPDAGHLELDATAEDLSGYATAVRLTRTAGLHWRGRVQLAATSPGFEVNDAGFQQSADRLSSHMRVQYVEQQVGRVLREWSISAGPDASWNYGRERLGTGLSAEANAQLVSYWTGEVRLDRGLAGFDDRLTRGGPLARGRSSSRVYASVDSDDRKRWVVSAEADHAWDEAGGSGTELALALSLRPAEKWRISVEPHFATERAVAQFVGAVADTLATATFKRRYLFADLRETTLALETRFDFTFKPGLSLELYAQPFIGGASFGSVKELRAPRSFSFIEYGRDAGTVTIEGRDILVDPDGPGPAQSFQVEDEDFSRRSLRGNAVLRWEWRPGSTLFLVWQQRRAGEDVSGRFEPARGLGRLLRERADNVLMVKATYWFGR